MARRQYPWLVAATWLIRTFRSIDRIERVEAPVLVAHGRDDELIRLLMDSACTHRPELTSARGAARPVRNAVGLTDPRHREAVGRPSLTPRSPSPERRAPERHARAALKRPLSAGDLTGDLALDTSRDGAAPQINPSCRASRRLGRRPQHLEHLVIGEHRGLIGREALGEDHHEARPDPQGRAGGVLRLSRPASTTPHRARDVRDDLARIRRVFNAFR